MSKGPTATRDWYRDVMAEGVNHGASGYFVTLGEPLHEDVTGEAAHLSVPATMMFEAGGEKVTQSGAIHSGLRRRSDGWRIAAWAWTKGKQ